MTACDCSFIDYEAPSVFRQEARTARKAHACSECGRIIDPGDTYGHVTGCWDGHWSTFRTCAPCRAIRADYCSGGHEYGGLRETLWECLGIDYVDGRVAGWAVEA